jgi:hypothetical protein
MKTAFTSQFEEIYNILNKAAIKVPEGFLDLRDYAEWIAYGRTVTNKEPIDYIKSWLKKRKYETNNRYYKDLGFLSDFLTDYLRDNTN